MTGPSSQHISRHMKRYHFRTVAAFVMATGAGILVAVAYLFGFV